MMNDELRIMTKEEFKDVIETLTILNTGIILGAAGMGVASGELFHSLGFILAPIVIITWLIILAIYGYRGDG